MNRKLKWHPKYDQIEAYVLGNFGAPESPAVAKLECHLLTCPACILQAEEALDFVRAVREAFLLWPG
jgi:hypothetical protein